MGEREGRDRTKERERREMPLLLDGGLGTALEAKGIVINEDHLWSTRLLLDDPETLVETHAEFYAAGSNVVTTASYQFSFEGLQERGLSKQQASQILRSSVGLVDRARKQVISQGLRKANEALLIAASLGTFTATLADGSEFTGVIPAHITYDHLVKFHSERIRALLDQHSSDLLPDFIALETIPCLVELRAILEALTGIDLKGVSVWVSLSCKSPTQLNSGESVTDAVELINGGVKVSFIGFNCLDPRNVQGLVELCRSVARPPKQFVIYPNRGEKFVDRAFDPNSGTADDEFLALISVWMKLFPELIYVLGGCCRIGPETISKMALLLHERV